MAIVNNVGDVWQVVVNGRQEGQQVLNVMHFQTAVNNSSLETQLLDALITCLVALIPKMNTNYVFEKLTCKQVMPILGPIIERTPGAGQASAGAAVGDGLPTFNSALISIRTTRGGRSGRGRIYLPGIPEGATTGSSLIVENPYYQAILAYIVCVAAKFVQSGENLNSGQLFHLGVISRKIGGAKPPFAAGAFARATSLQATTLIASTVSRKVGRGS